MELYVMLKLEIVTFRQNRSNDRLGNTIDEDLVFMTLIIFY